MRVGSILFSFILAAASILAGETISLEADFSKPHPKGEFRALHGGNGGSLQGGGILDLTARFKEIGTPLLRLHDCHWPNPDVVDIHTLFPNFAADPEDPASYDFRKTDEFIAATLKSGAKIVYRLGESIEHTKVRQHVHPPKDVAKWAAICVGIVRHYNDGWANGFKHGIQYWEIWNEPENRPSMWSGTDADYFALYETTAKVLKSRWPGLKVGGPALGYTGKLEKGKFEPGEFMRTFLAHCKSKSAPLDFFSWHLYSNDPGECVLRAAGIRAELNRQGFEGAESHLNEWNYLPDNDWSPMMGLKTQGAPREAYFARIGGAEGAAFTAAALLNLQDSSVDQANYYSFESGGFGTFSQHGAPLKPFYALKAFNALMETPVRVETTGATRVAVGGGLSRDKRSAVVLIGNTGAKDQALKFTPKNLPWDGATKWELWVVDASRNLEVMHSGLLPTGGSLELELDLKAPAVGLIRMKKE